MKIAIILGALLLAGCGTAPPAMQIVEVPVYVPCVKELPARPDYEFDHMAITDSNGSKILALARDWVRSRKYEYEIEALISGCREVK